MNVKAQIEISLGRFRIVTISRLCYIRWQRTVKTQNIEGGVLSDEMRTSKISETPADNKFSSLISDAIIIVLALSIGKYTMRYYFRLKSQEIAD